MTLILAGAAVIGWALAGCLWLAYIRMLQDYRDVLASRVRLFESLSTLEAKYADLLGRSMPSYPTGRALGFDGADFRFDRTPES